MCPLVCSGPAATTAVNEIGLLVCLCGLRIPIRDLHPLQLNSLDGFMTRSLVPIFCLPICFIACTPRSSAPPPAASSEPAALPGTETPSAEATGEAAEIPADALSAFVTIEGACHWALLDPNTGKPAWSTATPSPECPHRAFRTTNNGEALLSVDIEEKGEALWHQATELAPLTALTPLPYNEIAWFENGQIHGQTFSTDP